MKKRKPRNWQGVAIFALYGVAVAAASAYVATKYVSPCVCMVVAQRGVLN